MSWKQEFCRTLVEGSLKVVIQAEYLKMQVSFPEQWKHAFQVCKFSHFSKCGQRSLLMSSWQILFGKGWMMQWMCFERKAETGRLLSTPKLIFRHFWRFGFSVQLCWWNRNYRKNKQFWSLRHMQLDCFFQAASWLAFSVKTTYTLFLSC